MSFNPTIAPLPPAGCLLTDGGRRPVLSAFRGGIGRHEFGLNEACQRPLSGLAHGLPGPGRLRKSADESSLFHAPRMREQENPCPRYRPDEMFGGLTAQ